MTTLHWSSTPSVVMEEQTKNSTTNADDDEDDYMNMIIAEPSKPKEKETYTQRRLRKEREVCQPLCPPRNWPLRDKIG